MYGNAQSPFFLLPNCNFFCFLLDSLSFFLFRRCICLVGRKEEEEEEGKERKKEVVERRRRKEEEAQERQGCHLESFFLP